MMVLGIKRPRDRQQCGVALIIVLLTLFTLSAMAGIFAYAMKVETRLAANTTNGTELEWLGRSGLEIAKWILVQQETIPSERGFFALDQFWAGGPGPEDSVDNPFAGMSLKDIPVGDGRVSLEIIDQERWLNINTVFRKPPLMDLALSLAGAGATDSSLVTGALTDWIDKDDLAQAANGAESEFYLGLDHPTLAKDGPIDDIRELLLVRGITPEIFWGPDWRVTNLENSPGANRQILGSEEQPGAGLAQIFCALSNGRVNINTAPEPVLRILLGGDGSLAREIVKVRTDQPARNPGEISRLLGPAGIPGATGQFTTQSFTFSVRVVAKLGGAQETFRGFLRRSGAREYQVLLFRRE